MGLIYFWVLAIISTGYDNLLLTKVMAEIWEYYIITYLRFTQSQVKTFDQTTLFIGKREYCIV